MVKSLKGLRPLLEDIAHDNELARSKSGEEAIAYHMKCKESVKRLANSNFGNISSTIKVLSEIKAEIGCEACMDTFAYVNACLSGNWNTKSDIEKKYHTNLGGAIMIVDGIIYSDPNVRCPW